MNLRPCFAHPSVSACVKSTAMSIIRSVFIAFVYAALTMAVTTGDLHALTD